MKLIVCLSAFVQLINLPYAQGQSSPSPDSVMARVSRKLHTLKSIKYDDIRELNYPSENYHVVSTWASYYDFKSTDTLAGFKYQIEDTASKRVFNGTEEFFLDKKARTMQIDDHPGKNNFRGLSFLYNSLVTLRNVFPILISDIAAVKTVSDTTIDRTSCILITADIGKRRIQNLGTGFDAMQTRNKFIYKIAVDKDTWLPLEVLQINDLNNDLIKTTFKNIEIEPRGPEDLSWYYSTYTNEYKQGPDKSGMHPLIPINSSAPEWSLESFNGGNTVSLKDLKGKVVLLDFWIKNCGPCIESVPHLNELQEKLKAEKFKIMSINSYDPKSDVGLFCKNHHVDYPVLLNGKMIAEKYGVDSFPTFIILDGNGKVIYTQAGYDASVESKIEEIIRKAL